MAKRNFGFVNNLITPQTTRARSKKQETRLAKMLNGHTTINSGATFGQNDVFTDFCEVEAKTTQKDSYSIKLSDWRLLRKKCAGNKFPIFVIDFEQSKDTLAIMTMDDLEFLLNQIQHEDNK